MKTFFIILFCLYFSMDISAGDNGDIYGAHPAANAMGNAVTATVNDSSSVFYNVAGLGKMSEGDKIFANLEKKKKEQEAGAPEKETPPPWGRFKERASWEWNDIRKGTFTYTPSYRSEKTPHELTLQYNIARPRLNTSAPTNQDLTKTKDDYAGLGLTLNLNSIYDLKRNFRFGLNMLMPASGNLLVINDVNPTAHRYLQSGQSNQKPIIMGGLGIELWKDRLFAGIGFTALAGGKGSMLLKDVPITPDKAIPNQQATIEVKPMINPVYGLAFQYGKFMAGVSYRREVELGMDPISARAQTTLLGIQMDLDVAVADHFTPRKWAYGIGYKPKDSLTFTFDINRELWSAYKLSRTKNTYSDPWSKFYMNDITVVRGGAEFALFDWLKLRAGLARRPRPTPTMAGTNNIMDFDRFIVTGGTSLILAPGMFSFLPNLKSPIILDFVVEYQKLHGEHIYKYFATQRNPNYSMGGNVWHFGFSVTTFL